jgi:endonuclease/exonuclease/phosphatase family metal-dependent hydrolase
MWTASYSKDSLTYTYPSDNPVKKIDYIMFYPRNRWKVLETKVIQDAIASDHCAYLVILKLLDE